MSTIRTKKKFLLVFLFILAGVAALFWGTLEKTSSNDYCSSCHMMKPEFLTMKASSHSQLACVACHVEPGIMKKVEYKLVNIKEWISILTGDYGIVITSTTPIPDATCTQCHDMTTRKVTPSGDLIIPHSKHTQAGVSCTLCHTGIAHGNIVEKQATFRTDYGKWDDTIAKSIMSDVKNIRPDMDVCFSCHKLRNAPLNCSACHTSSMLPSNHKDEAFKNGAHGQLAAKDIKVCDACHSYMSTVPVVVSKGTNSAVEKFLSKDNAKSATMSASDYAKANTFCKACHGKRPPSHDADFMQNHGALAAQNKDRCFTCHENRPGGIAPVTKVACGSCHPSVHYKDNWKPSHPIELPANPKVTDFCYTCHTKSCTKCHVQLKKTAN